MSESAVPTVPKTSRRRSRTRTAEQIGRTALGARPVPDLTPPRVARQPRTLRATLENGLDVIAVRKPATPLVEVRLRIPFAEPRVSPQKHAARTELVAAALLLGSPTRDREQIDRDLGDVGGNLHASVDAQRLGVSGSVLSTGLPRLLEVLADVLTDASYRPADVRGEQARLFEHLMISLSQPSSIARLNLQRRRFGDHPAAWDMPLPDDVMAVTPVDVRRTHQRLVVPRGSTLVLVGDLSPARTLDQVAKALSGWVSDTTARPLSTPPTLAGGPPLLVDRPAAVQSQVRLTAPALPRDHQGYPVQQLANLVYGGYFSSRLVENIREDKGFTYGASSSVQFWPGLAAFTVAFDTNTESTAAAVWETVYELGRMTLAPPAATELESARNYALGTLAASLATQAGYASMLSSLLGSGLDPSWLTDYTRAVAGVDADEVHALSRTLLAPAQFNGVVVGDVDEIGTRLAAILPVESA